ncbi:biotin biosynthesis protein BioC [Tritonibacter multivorans]|uniref:Biotin biosynthesis protein BioC n=1 Tax=Tritonibacter multivorans TaxID=928856 RepID=A0A0P1GFI7_9RHOB|nr:class I SAM-dependent methyltransferase [Tritonibacter multivorans]MDA7421067.1 class I SAM-dependent methyltransferase [Tritonibacter multivorans]CUH80245.1 biotin biosynthesis protein BioC [Tritonibacter multivorans]SFC76489.1 Methyltransferase domain-containing protein [Tritonibacter multivorans]
MTLQPKEFRIDFPDGTSSVVDDRVMGILRTLQSQAAAVQRAQPSTPRHCSVCDYHGDFRPTGFPQRVDASCPKCHSVERHRLIMLAVKRGQVLGDADENSRVLHFAPEPMLSDYFRSRFQHYVTADLAAGFDLQLNMENIDLPDAQYDVIMANHVLEHVDDFKAARELHRILKPGGVLLCTVPLIEGWEETYEPEGIDSDAERLLHFGQHDHVRMYGRDFRDRIQSCGFALEAEITSEGADVVKYSLLRGEKLFLFRKA